MNDVITSDDFQRGLTYGAAAVVVVITVALATSRARPGVVPVAGVALSAAGLAAVAGAKDVPGGLAAGVALLALAGAAAARAPLAAAGLSIPGAWLIATRAELPVERWAEVAVLVAIVVGGAGAADLDRRAAGRGLAVGPVLLAATCGGMYVTTPDTHRSLALFGAALPFVLAGFPRALASLGGLGTYASVGVVAWVGARDGVARDGAVVGALACLGLLVCEPAARLLARSRDGVVGLAPGTAALTVTVAAAHAALVLFVARVAGLRDSAATAAVIAAAGFVVAIVALVLIFRPAARLSVPRS